MKSQFFQTALTRPTQDFMQVDHLVLRGSNFEMGRQLAEIAIHKHPGDPAKIGAQRRYMQKNFPLHYERMRGAASALGVDIEGCPCLPGPISTCAWYMPPTANWTGWTTASST